EHFGAVSGALCSYTFCSEVRRDHHAPVSLNRPLDMAAHGLQVSQVRSSAWRGTKPEYAQGVAECGWYWRCNRVGAGYVHACRLEQRECLPEANAAGVTRVVVGHGPHHHRV